ncbi:uncharacterized protein LOC113316073 [Papaver somniferum]|uniref:uncharacterized protein LOC113316073 n=1 Tax=Papaver somniferum TaxID=3469 RepID=UPI000E6F8809|nr:uncharacterized protein LOC113316073 [Papaver somniferum]
MNFEVNNDVSEIHPSIVDLSKTPEIHPAINMIDEQDNNRYDSWKFSLIGRLDFLRIKFSKATTLLRKQWSLKGQCHLIPLGKGFFTIKLDNEEDKTYIKTGNWEVLDQILKVRNWIANFRSENQRTSKAMVWVHFPGLSLEYWDEKTLFKISRSIGNPIKVDAATLNYQSGYYAKVLIEIDLAKSIPNKLWIVTRNNMQTATTDGQKVSTPSPTKHTHGDTSSPQMVNQSITVPSLISKLIEIPQFSSPNTSVINRDESSRATSEDTSKGEDPFIDVTKGISNPGLTSISNLVIQIDNNQYEVLQDNDNEYSEDEDGEIKEVSTSSLLEFGSISQPVIILQKEKIITQYVPEVNENSKMTGLKRQKAKDKLYSLVKTNNLTSVWVVELKIKAHKSGIKLPVEVGGVLVTGIHVNSYTVNRRVLWKDLYEISFLDKPWLLIGDFNTVLNADEKKGGRSPLNSAMSDFKDFVDSCGLIQSPKSGLELSWCNGRVRNKRILCNLDGALYNLKWLDTFSGWHYHVATMGISNHGPLIGSDTVIERALNTPFRFQQMWLTHPSFLQVVIDSWNEDLASNPIFMFMNKLKRLKKILKI